MFESGALRGAGSVVVSYLVLARKFRPQKFEEIIGQEHVTTTLQNAISSDRAHHAFLFCGARGTGKTTTARVLAKALNCAEGPTPNPCNVCSSCKDITAGSSVDVMEIDGASHTGVDDIRELRENVRYAPSRSRRKIYIIDEVHMLSVSAFNALLKTLEEPPPHVTFMFATTEPHKIPATILSRCQRFDLRRVAPTVLKKHLAVILKKEGFEAHDDGLDLLALESGGSVRDSLSLMDQVIAYAGTQPIDRDLVARVLGVTDRSTLTALSGALIKGDTDTVLSLINEVFEAGWDLVQFARSLVEHIRDLAVLATCKTPESFVALGDEALDVLKKQIAQTDGQRLLQFFDAAARAVDETARSEFPKMTLEMNLLEMTLSEPLIPIGDLTAKLERMENRLLRGGTPTGGNPSTGGSKGGAASGSGERHSRSGASYSKRHQKQDAAEHTTQENSQQQNAVEHTPQENSQKDMSRIQEISRGKEEITVGREGVEGILDVKPPTPESSPATNTAGMLEKWATIVSMVRKENKFLAATLSSVQLESLEWTEKNVQVGLVAETDGFAAEQLLDGGLSQAGTSAGKVLRTPVKITLRTTDKLEIQKHRTPYQGMSGSNKKKQNESSAPSTPRSLRDRKDLIKKKRQEKIRMDAKSHPTVQEVKQVLGGKIKKIDVLS